MWIILLGIILGLFLAYANGANDNFKGVATLLGSGTTDFKRALLWGTGCTFLGSMAAIVLAKGLLVSFSGKGLVPESIIAMKSFAFAVVLAAALTVILATRFGFPISTTHSLIGALLGTGVFASASGVNFSQLVSVFIIPLIFSPLVALLLVSALYPLLRFVRIKLGVEKETCLCIGTEVIAVIPQGVGQEQAMLMVQSELLQFKQPSVSVGTEAYCQVRYSGNLLGINSRDLLDFFHFLSAGIVSFARGLNDTPKIAALLLVGGTVSPAFTFVSVATVMAMGGILSSKKVAETMSHKVTAMNAGQGFTANLITGLVVLFASNFGLPVSTTHVSCGALFGIGAVTGQARWKAIASVLLAWVITLPLSAMLGAFIFYLSSCRWA